MGIYGSFSPFCLREDSCVRRLCETCAVCAVHSERRENVSVMSDCARACVAVRVCVCYKGEARARGGEEPLVLTLSDVTRPHMPH